MRRSHRALIVLLLAAPLALAQTTPGEEDFEDDALGFAATGSNPDADWYSFTPTQHANCLTSASTSYTKVVDGTGTTDGAIEGQSLRFQSIGAEYCGGDLDLTPPVASDLVAFDIHLECGLVTETTLYRFRVYNTDLQIVVDSWFRSSASCNFEWRLNPGSGPVVCNFVEQGGNTPSQNSHHLSVSFDYAAQQYTASSELAGCNDQTLAFSNAASSIGRISFIESSSPTGSRHLVIDNFGVADAVVIPEEVEPSEFDSGFISFAKGMGFRTSESLMLFGLIVVGAATTSTGSMVRFMASGKPKNFLAAGVAMGTAIFASTLFNVDFWMTVMAVVLGFFAVQGSHEARNSFFELKSNLANLRRPSFVDDEGAPVAAEPKESPGNDVEPAEPSAAPEPQTEDLPEPQPADTPEPTEEPREDGA